MELHPELGVGHGHSEKRSASWYGFFVGSAGGGAVVFLPGSFTYHWHNRYELGTGVAGSWADTLHARYRTLSLEKAGVCGA